MNRKECHEEYRNCFGDSMYISKETDTDYEVLDDDLNLVESFSNYKKANDYILKERYYKI